MARIQIDVDAVMKQVEFAAEQALETAASALINYMRSEVDKTSTYPAKWASMVKADIKRFALEKTEKGIKLKVGLDYDVGSYQWLRALVIAYGMGEKSSVFPHPIFRRPGEQVWDNDLSGMHTSIARNGGELPSSWYHAGSGFIANAMDTLAAVWQDFVDLAIKLVPANAIVSNLIVVP